MTRDQVAMTVRQELDAVWNNALGLAAGEPAANADRIDVALNYIMQVVDHYRADNEYSVNLESE